MTLNSRSGFVMTAFATLLITNLACDGGKKKTDGSVDAKDQTGGDKLDTQGSEPIDTGSEIKIDTMPPDVTPDMPGTEPMAEKLDVMGEGGGGGGGGTADGMDMVGGGGGGDGGGIEPPPCPTPCTLGDTRCAPSGAPAVETCTMVGACTTFTPSDVCGAAQTCDASAGPAACVCKAAPAECMGVTTGTVCGTDGLTVHSCSTDADGCVGSTVSTVCSGAKTCQGAPGSAACTCNNTCLPTELGSYCIDENTRGICSMTAEGCFARVIAETCPLGKKCEGGAGAASCACPANTPDSDFDQTRIGEHGTGCSMDEATGPDFGPDARFRCDPKSGRITRCELIASCYVWNEQPACGTGLGCTTDGTSGAGNPVAKAYCGCKDVADGKFYVNPEKGHDGQFTLSGVTVKPTGNPDRVECMFKTITCAAESDGIGGANCNPNTTTSDNAGAGANAWVGQRSQILLTSVNAVSPILVTTTGTHNIKGGWLVTTSGVVGNRAANGTFTALTGSDCTAGTAGSGDCDVDELELKASTGNGDFVVTDKTVSEVIVSGSSVRIKVCNSINGTTCESATVDTKDNHNLVAGDTVELDTNGCDQLRSGSYSVAPVAGMNNVFQLTGVVALAGVTACDVDLVERIVPSGPNQSASIVLHTEGGTVTFDGDDESNNISIASRVSITNSLGGGSPDTFIVEATDNQNCNDYFMVSGSGTIEGFTVNNEADFNSGGCDWTGDTGSAGAAYSFFYANDDNGNDMGPRIFKTLRLNGRGPDNTDTPARFTRTGVSIYADANDHLDVELNDVIVGGDDLIASAGNDEGFADYGIYIQTGDVTATNVTVRNTGRAVAGDFGGFGRWNGHGIYVDNNDTDYGNLVYTSTNVISSNNTSIGLTIFASGFSLCCDSQDHKPEINIHGGSIDHNLNDGFVTDESVINIDMGAKFTDNEGWGIDTSWGGDCSGGNGSNSITIDSTVVITANFNGLNIGDHAATLTGNTINDNLGDTSGEDGDGVQIDNEEADTCNTPDPSFNVDFNNVTVTGNSNNGIRVFRADLSTSAHLVKMNNSHIHTNGNTVTTQGHGVWLDSDCNEETSVSILGTEIYSNRRSGLFVNDCDDWWNGQLAHFGVHDSDVRLNNVAMDVEMGGIVVEGSAHLVANDFTGNQVRRNWGPEIRFYGQSAQEIPDLPPGTSLRRRWDLTPLSDACGDDSNIISCYAGMGGPQTNDVGVYADNDADVDARFVKWQANPPSTSTGAFGTGTCTTSCDFFATSPCTPVVSCP